MNPQNPSSLPRRDLLLLPAIAMATILVMVCVSEVLARGIWPEHLQNVCGGYSYGGVRSAKPNCVMQAKNAEGPNVTYRFNECGYRSQESCGPKPPGTLRVAVVGTSIGAGLYVPYEETFAERAARELSLATGHKVEVQNLAEWGPYLEEGEKAVAAALSLHPEAIVLPVTPADLTRLIAFSAAPQHGNAVRQFQLMWLLSLRQHVKESRTVLMLEHFLVENTDLLFKLYRSYGDVNDPLHVPPSKLCSERFAAMDALLGRISGVLEQSQTPIIIVSVPNRIQAVMAQEHKTVSGTDPYAFSRNIRAMAARYRMHFIDTLPDFAEASRSEECFYPADGHPNSEGHRIIAAAVTKYMIQNLAVFQRSTVSATAERN